MRNGINVAALSEVANEIKMNPTEAAFRYEVSVRWDGGHYYNGTVRTARVGTTLAARNFSVCIAPTQEIATLANTRGIIAHFPEELFVVGLGGCVLITTLMGLTTQQLGISQLQLQIGASFSVYSESGKAPSHPELFDFSYAFRCRSDGDIEKLQDIVDAVKNYSPNHRTLAESNEIRVVVSKGNNDAISSISMMAAVPAMKSKLDYSFHAERVEMECSWERAFQLECRMLDSRFGEETLAVDVPKQMGGIDKAPNPQEYLLLGTAASIAQALIGESIRKKIPLDGLEVVMSGLVDLRGIMRIDPAVSPKVQDMACDIHALGTASLQDYGELTRSALSKSSLVTRLLNPTTTQVEVRHESHTYTQS